MTRRRIAILMRRHLPVQRRLRRLPKRCKAPLLGSRPPMSMRYACWSFISGTLGILAIHWMTGLVGHPLLIGVQGAAGPEYILVPVLAGALILLATALFTNNVVYHRRYPTHWL